MGYERYPRGDDDGRRDTQDYGRDYGSGRDYSYSSAREYRAAGMIGRDATQGNRRSRGRGQENGVNVKGGGVVEPRGIEPLTSAVRLQRSPI